MLNLQFCILVQLWKKEKKTFTINKLGQDSVWHLREWITRVDSPLVADIALGQG